MKTCTRCLKSQPLVNFCYRRKEKNDRQPTCKSCNAKDARERYTENCVPYRNSNKRLLKKKWSLIRSLKENKPCMDCKVVYPYYVLDFDHLPEHSKSFNLAMSEVGKHSFKELKDEVAKCELVCSNCHRIRTAKRRPSRT